MARPHLHLVMILDQGCENTVISSRGNIWETWAMLDDQNLLNSA